jgi:hypothetical protein
MEARVQVRVIICGGRDDHFYGFGPLVIDSLGRWYGQQLVIVHGAARGVDEEAGAYARSLGLKVEEFPAGWEKHGRAAGHIRNQAMLESGADAVIAFKRNFNWALDRGGTEDMVRRAKEAGVPAWVVSRA